MFIRVKTSPNSPRQSVQIVQSLRHGSHVKQVILRHVGVADDAAELVRLKELGQVLLQQMLQEETPGLFLPDQLPPITAATPQGKRTAPVPVPAQPTPLPVDLQKLRERERSIRGIHEVYGQIYQDLGFADVIGQPSIHRSAVRLLKQMVMARLACPASKRQSVRDLDERFGIRLSLPAVYRMMDHVEQTAIERLNQLAHASAMGLLGGKIHLVFYDCTTLYFESFQDDEDAKRPGDLKQDDASKDKDAKQGQAGNDADTPNDEQTEDTTNSKDQKDDGNPTRDGDDPLQSKGLRSKGFSKENRFNQTQVLLALAVSSEGLPLGYELFPGKTSEGKTFKTFLERVESRWRPTELVVVADSAMLSEANIALLEEKGYGYIVGARLKSLDRATALKVQQHGTETSIHEVPLSDKSKLVVSYDPVRARKDAHEREKAIARLKKKLERSKSPKGLLNAKGAGRFLKLEGECQVQLNEQAVAAASVWDGLHGVTTNLLEMEGKDVREQYHGLWQVEACFRVSKHDLRFRPIFHWSAQHIRAHVAICFMALCCVRTLMYRVKLQQGAMSAETIRRALLSVQVSVYEHADDGQCYELPGRPLAEAGKLYRTMGLKLQTAARRLEVKMH